MNKYTVYVSFGFLIATLMVALAARYVSSFDHWTALLALFGLLYMQILMAAQYIIFIGKRQK